LVTAVTTGGDRRHRRANMQSLIMCLLVNIAGPGFSREIQAGREAAGGDTMKRVAIAILFAGVLMMVSGGFAMAGRTEEPKAQKAVVVFDEPVKLLNVILKGQYLFVHDDELMAQ